MAVAKPFCGLRPSKDYVEQFHCPPYDVMDRDEARKLAENKPYSFLHVTRSDLDLPDSIDEHDTQVYLNAKMKIEEFINKKVLIKDSKPCYYFYEETWKGKRQLGLFAVVKVQEYENGTIRRHEFTRKEKEVDRTNHIVITKTHTEPVFLTYKDHGKIEKTIEKFINKNKPEYFVKDENEVIHKVWICSDENINKIIEDEFKKVDILYIADGHHRTASSLNAAREFEKQNPDHNGEESYNYFMAVIYPSNHLRILPYNRVVKDLNGLTTEQFINKLKELGDIKQTKKTEPDKKHTIMIYIDGRWFEFVFKKSLIPDDPVNSLDVAILQNNILEPVLGIVDPRTDKRITFVGGIRGTKELENLVNNKGYKVAFSMFATDINDLIKVADNHQVMPPKSTWFEPKLRSGFVIHQID
ncbi:MAG: DUF1015 domain-containing protein [Exilispira sp.]